MARNVLKLIGDSERCSEAARLTVFPEESRREGVAPPPRVQDVYSLRCAPQVHGPVIQALDYIEGVIATEINSATDNPLIFDDGKGGYVAPRADTSTANTSPRRWTCSPSRWRISAPFASAGWRA